MSGERLDIYSLPFTLTLLVIDDERGEPKHGVNAFQYDGFINRNTKKLVREQ